MKAILIDPVLKVITEVEHDGDFKQIYTFLSDEANDLKVDCFTAVSIGRPEGKGQGRENHIFVDDEGLLKEPRYFFEWQGYGDPLAGRGLILGCDNEGETASTDWTVDQVADKVTFTELSVLGFDPIDGETDMYGIRVPVIGHRPIFGKPKDK